MDKGVDKGLEPCFLVSIPSTTCIQDVERSSFSIDWLGIGPGMDVIHSILA